MTDPTNPLIVQGDLTVLVELASPRADDARAALSRFAELERAPEHIHTYRISPLTLWNAAVAGLSPGDVASTLTGFAKYDVAPSVLAESMALGVTDMLGARLTRFGDMTTEDFLNERTAPAPSEYGAAAPGPDDAMTGRQLSERYDEIERKRVADKLANRARQRNPA